MLCHRVMDSINFGNYPHRQEYLPNLASTSALGAQEWVTHEAERWRCPQCGLPMLWYDTECARCAESRSESSLPVTDDTPRPYWQKSSDLLTRRGVRLQPPVFLAFTALLFDQRRRRRDRWRRARAHPGDARVALVQPPPRSVKVRGGSHDLGMGRRMEDTADACGTLARVAQSPRPGGSASERRGLAPSGESFALR